MPDFKHELLRGIIKNVESLRIPVSEKLIALNPCEEDIQCIKKYAKKQIKKAEINSKFAILEKAKKM